MSVMVYTLLIPRQKADYETIYSRWTTYSELCLAHRFSASYKAWINSAIYGYRTPCDLISQHSATNGNHLPKGTNAFTIQL